MADSTKVFVPKQRVKRGVAGYRGKDVMVVDDKGKAKAAPTRRTDTSRTRPTDDSDD